MGSWKQGRKLGVAIGVAVAIGAWGCGDGDDGIAGPGAGQAARVAAMAPAPGNDYVATDQGFVVEFTQPMARSSVKAAYSATMGGRPVPGRFSWSADRRAMGFSPDAALPAGAEVQVRWGAGMHDAEGQPVAGEDGQPLEPFDFTCTAYAAPTDFASAGEQIYFTATSPSGEEITFTMGDDFDGAHMPGYGAIGPGGMGMMRVGTMGSGSMGFGMMGSGTTGSGMMGSGMMSSGMMGSGEALAGRHYGMACVSCHGPEGEGGRYLAMGSARAPSLRYAVLTGQEGGGEEAEHTPYDDESLARAITDGVDPDGEELSGFMPRWTMSSADLQALVEYLKTL